MSDYPDRENWFFLDGVLHRALAINRVRNYVKAFDYSDERVKMYKWDEVLHSKEKAYSIAQVSEFINRKPRTIRYYIKEGMIEPTGIAKRGKLPLYFFNKHDIMKMRDMVEEYSKNAPWGQIPLPTREQLRSMLTSGSVLYIKDGDEFVPVWKAKF